MEIIFPPKKQIDNAASRLHLIRHFLAEMPPSTQGEGFLFIIPPLRYFSIKKGLENCF